MRDVNASINMIRREVIIEDYNQTMAFDVSSECRIATNIDVTRARNHRRVSTLLLR
jgi:hypothetical protein